MKIFEKVDLRLVNTVILLFIFVVAIITFNNSLEIEKKINAELYDTPEMLKLKLECADLIQNMSNTIVFIQDIDIEEKEGNIICHSMVGFNCSANIGHKKSYNTNITYPYIKYACPDIMYYKVKMNDFWNAINCNFTDEKFTINITARNITS